jgi:hypothetical protein
MRTAGVGFVRFVFVLQIRIDAVVFGLARIPHEMVLRSHAVAPVVPSAPVLECLEQALAHRQGSLFGVFRRAVAFRHLRVDKARRDAAHQKVGVLAGQQTGVTGHKCLAQSIGVTGTVEVVFGVLVNVLPGGIPGRTTGTQKGPIGLGPDRPHVDGTRPAAHVDDPALGLVQKGNKVVADALGPVQIRVEDVSGVSRVEADPGVVDNAPQCCLALGEGGRRRCHRIVIGSVEFQEIDGSLASLFRCDCALDLGDGVHPLLLRPGRQQHVTIVFEGELLAEGVTDSLVSSGD